MTGGESMSNNNQKNMRTIVALTGAKQFQTEMLKTASVLSMDGSIVLMPFKPIKVVHKEVTKERFKKLQRDRIDMADMLTVVNPDGIIDESTQQDIDYALSKGKPISYLVQMEQAKEKPKTITLCGSPKFRREFERIYTELTLNKGWLVYVPAIFMLGYVDTDMCYERRELLDSLHKQKMKLSDQVWIITSGDISSEPEALEAISFCEKHNIPVEYCYVHKGESSTPAGKNRENSVHPKEGCPPKELVMITSGEFAGTVGIIEGTYPLTFGSIKEMEEYERDYDGLLKYIIRILNAEWKDGNSMVVLVDYGDFVKLSDWLQPIKSDLLRGFAMESSCRVKEAASIKACQEAYQKEMSEKLLEDLGNLGKKLRVDFTSVDNPSPRSEDATGDKE